MMGEIEEDERKISNGCTRKVNARLTQLRNVACSSYAAFQRRYRINDTKTQEEEIREMKRESVESIAIKEVI